MGWRLCRRFCERAGDSVRMGLVWEECFQESRMNEDEKNDILSCLPCGISRAIDLFINEQTDL